MCEVIVVRVYNSEFINYSYIVYDDKGRGILIDPAWDAEKIISAANQKRLDLKAVLITHEHYDHINLAEYMSLHYNIPIYSSIEVETFFDETINDLITISNETPIRIGNLMIRPILTPGHTKGSISYLINRNFFSGDTLFIEGCGMCEDPSSNPRELFASLRRLMNIIPLSTRIYPGHRYHEMVGQYFSYVLSHNIYINIDNEEDFVNFRMRSGQKNLMNFV